MELKIMGEPTIDFFADLQKLAVKHKITIITSQQKKSKSFLSKKEVAESFTKVIQSSNTISIKISKETK